MLYKTTVIFEKTGTGYSAYAPDFDGCIATGRNIEECSARMQRALKSHIEGMVEDGDEVPEESDFCTMLAVQIDEPGKEVDPDALKEYRTATGKTQAEFARELDVTPETISEWERGKRKIPGILKFAFSKGVRLSTENVTFVRGEKFHPKGGEKVKGATTRGRRFKKEHITNS